MQQIAVKNFRVFGAPSMFDLSPVTILTGRNNAGKSSLIKALLLLADFIEQDDQTVLRLDGPRAPRHKITSFDNLKNWEVAEDVVRLSYTMGDVQFEYDFSRHAEPIMAQLTCFRIITPALKEELELKLVDEQGLSYYFTVRQALIDYIVNEDAYLALQSQSFLSEAAKAESRLAALDEEIVRKKAQFDKNPEMLRYQAVASAFAQLSSKREELTERIQELKASADSHKVRDKGLVYFGRVNLEEVDLGTTSLPRIIQHGLLAYIDADATRTAQELKYLAEQARSTLVRFYQELQQLMRFPLAHLGPNRTYQSRLYFSHQLGSEITSIVEAFMHRGIRRGSTADMFLRRWLPMFNVGDSVNVTPVEGMAFKITINVTGRKGSPINLADLGFGAGQILTILLQIASVIERQEERAKAGKSRNVAAILLIEEPEANLHPQLQSLLAVLFEEVTRNFSIRLIVETHSEYLIRKLQLLVASAKVGVEHGNNVMLYYMDQTLDDTGLPATSVRRIIIQPDGKLSDDFGNGFFDEADENAMELYRLQKKAARQLLA
jgi:predicted ATP-binding protein involved in virulence